MNPGLYQDRISCQQTLEHCKATAADENASPHIRHNAGVNAEMEAHKIRNLDTVIAEDIALISEIQGTLNALHVSKHKTPDRLLARTRLEEAQDRLRRELGPVPATL